MTKKKIVRTGELKYHHGDLRRAIVSSALRLIAQSGVQNLSLREIARELGVTTGAPYHHFKDREALLVQIGIQGFGELLQCLGSALEGTLGGLAELEAESRAYLNFARRNAALYSVMFSREVANQDRYPELRETADRCFHMVCASVAKSTQLSGQEIAEAALCVWATLHGLAVLDQNNFLEEGPSEQERIAVRGVLSIVKGPDRPVGS